MRLRLLAVIPLCLAAAACTPSGPPRPGPVSIFDLSADSVGPNICVLDLPGGLYITYPDLDALSLNLLRLTCPPEEEPQSAGQAPGLQRLTYLDRISETPEVGSWFGNAPLVQLGGTLNTFYADSEREGGPVLKWVSGPTGDDAEKRWIDILPFSGEPVAAFARPDGTIDLFLLQGGALVRRNLSGAEPETLLSPCAPVGDLSVFREGDLRGFTFFDGSSQRLYEVLSGPEGTKVRPVHACGSVHSSLLLEGRLRTLVFSAPDSALLLLEEQGSGAPAKVTPVTPCEGVTSVSLFYRNGRPAFLYTERSGETPRERRTLLTLLYPDPSPGAKGYRKSVLLDVEQPLREMRVVPVCSRLLILFVQDKLKATWLDPSAFSSE